MAGSYLHSPTERKQSTGSARTAWAAGRHRFPPCPPTPSRVPARLAARAPQQSGMSFSTHILAVVPAAVIGLVAGLLAIVFTIANIKVRLITYDHTSIMPAIICLQRVVIARHLHICAGNRQCGSPHHRTLRVYAGCFFPRPVAPFGQPWRANPRVPARARACLPWSRCRCRRW